MADSNNPIGFNDLFNFDDRSQIQAAIQDVRSLRRAYADFLKLVDGPAMAKIAQNQATLATSIRDLSTSTKSLTATNQDHQRQLESDLTTIQALR